MPGRWKITCRSSRGTKDSASFTEYATSSQEKQSTASERTQARCPALAAVLAPERFAVEFVRVFSTTSCSGRRRTWPRQPEMRVLRPDDEKANLAHFNRTSQVESRATAGEVSWGGDGATVDIGRSVMGRSSLRDEAI